MYLNKAILIGNLTRDPEVRAIPSGMKVANFSLATNRVYKDAQGQKKESVDYHNVVVFGRQAETAGQYLKKGQSVLVEGRMQTRSWDDKDGQKKYRTEVIADRVQFGPKAAGGAGGGQAAHQEQSPEEKSSGKPPVEYPTEEINPEDIPF